MSQFLFQGDFRRKPIQTLGGNSRASEQRDALLQKAQAERQRRERDRAEQAAILRLQAFFRGCLDRKRMRAIWRQEFDSKRNIKTTDPELIRQMMLFNSFFRPVEDIQRFLELGKQMITRSAAVVQFANSDSTGVFEIQQILKKCLACLNMSHVPPAILLRLMETYTDPMEYEKTSSEYATLSNRTVEVVGSVLLYLVVESQFFLLYRQFLERKLPPMNDETVNRITDDSYLQVYKRIMSIRTELKNRSIVLYVKRKKYDASGAVELIFSKFVQSFAENVMPLEGNSGIAAYFIIPRLTTCIPWEEWCRVLPSVSQNLKENQDSVRQIFYVTLTFMKNLKISDIEIGQLIQTISLLLPSIDPKFAPVIINHGLARHMEEWEEEMEVEEEEPSVEDTKYYQECRMLYQMLKDVLNRTSIPSWLCPFQLSHWELMCDIISCIVRLEPKLASVDFNFLSALSYRRDFMRSLCLHCITTCPLANDDVLAFCWFFCHLLGTLHDTEFLNGIPIQKDELVKLIIVLRERFCNTILNEFEWLDTGAITTLKAVANTLMSLHDRNGRMSLFSEDIFISSTLSKICPVETHSINFGFLSVDSYPDLPPMDAKLLKILKDFPFALSFHDRVKVWNRLLDLDKEINDPNPMNHREDIQVRRNFIYEDAFEKLSPENVPNLRKHIRISLVNVVGVMEAGIDGGGLLREFLTESTKAAVDPNRGLFRFDSQNRIYPNPVAKKLLDNFRKHFFVVGRLVGKALYEQTLLELPMAAFFIQICIEGKVPSAVDFLATLDPGLHKNLLALKTFKGELNTLGLDFTLALDELGETRVVELKKNGKDIAVDETNVIEYIHLVADYKINKEMEDECRSFRAGMMDVIPTLRMFSWRELQSLISGSDKPIDIDDWRNNTNYGPGFTENHETVKMFWEVVRGFDEKGLRMLLKFVTSCSRPPLLGFKDLVPKFGLQSAGNTDRLPTAATCMNLLKLPEFGDASTMREKLLYVINAHAGFELS